MKRLTLIFIVLLFSVPVALWARQDAPTPRVEITGVNASQLPTAVITVNVYDALNQPVRGLTVENFELVGEFADRAEIVEVQNITDDNLAFATVLVIDVSSSMEGRPIVLAKEAAQTFVNSIGANDPVAVYTFGTDFELVQDYTTDKQALLDAIESIQAGGQTALYQGAYNAVDLAAEAPSSRRAVILLSDGAEYGGVSTVGRSAAGEQALIRGVPVYTIGLGFGADRTYLQNLAELTNARFYESPDPDQLQQIYSDLAALFRSQYVVTLNADLPLDGTEYDVTLQVTTDVGAGTASAILRAPIPTPIVRLAPIDAPVSEETTYTAEILADDPIDQVALQIDDREPEVLQEAPFEITIRPLELAPGTHTLQVTAVDEQGDAGAATLDFEVAALPPQVTVISNLAEGELTNKQTVLLEVTSQTPVVAATYSIEGLQSTTLAEPPYAFDVDPLLLEPGEHTLVIEVTNESGQVTVVEQSFSVASLPPYIVIANLAEDQVVDAPIEVEADVVISQTAVTDVTFTVDGVELPVREIPPDDLILATGRLDPIEFEPGPATLVMRGVNANGGETEVTVDFEIASLPPVIVFENLAEGDVLSEDLDVAISFASQTPVIHVAYYLDGEEFAHRTNEPWDVFLDVLELGPGEHTLRVVADTVSEQSSAEIMFIVSDAPSLTATALAPTATPTDDLDATSTAEQAALDLRATTTAEAQATVVAATQAADDATATQFVAAATGTAGARVTQTAAAAGTSSAEGAATSQAAAQADRDATSTAAFEATRVARSTMNAEQLATADARSTRDAQATQTAESGGTAIAMVAATQQAGATATEAQATATADALVTAGAAQTLDAARTMSAATAQARATESAFATATAEERATLLAQAEINAQGTANAQATQTAAVFTREAGVTETADARATANAQLTLDAAVELATATADARLTLTAEASATALAEEELAREGTQSAELTATADAQSTLDAQATRDTQLAAIGTEELTEEPTLVAQAATATPEVATEEPGSSPAPTLTPRGTLVPIEAETQSAVSASQLIPIIIIVAVAVILLIAMFIILRGSRRRRRP